MRLCPVLAIACALAACGGAEATDPDDDPADEEPGEEQARFGCQSPDPGWIWCDDFEDAASLDGYFEYQSADGSFVRASGVGRDDSWGMRARWRPGQVSAGFLHLAMGRTPLAYMDPVDEGTADYREIYWRLWVRYEPGWIGGGAAKLTRAFIFAGPDWSQAMIAHVWSGSPPNQEYLVTDPVSGTDAEGRVLTTSYNDFQNFQWLGARTGTTPLFSAAQTGSWHCVESHVRLNDPGRGNGVFRLWVDGNLDVAYDDLDWVGPYDEYGINAVYFENYWNQGSPAQSPQERYFDDIVVSTARIGC